MNWFQAIILGLVEGITEYLPVSSTGHLILASAFLGLTDQASKEAVHTFDIAVQGGAILAVLGLYWPRFLTMLAGLLGRNENGLRLLINIAIAVVPAAVSGLLLKKVIEERLFSPRTVAIAFMVGGVYMMIVEWMRVRNHRIFREETLRTFGAPDGLELERLTPFQALFIGLMQCVALIPGTSRSMMTITGGLFVRLKPAAAAEFSFLLGMPILLAATLYSMYKNIKESHAAGTPNFIQTLGVVSVAIGFAVAAVSAALAVKWLVRFLNRWGLFPFGVYRIIAGIVILIGARLGWFGS